MVDRRSIAAQTNKRVASSQERLVGTAFVSGTRMLYVGALVATRLHAHHAAQIIIAPDGIDIADGARGRVRARTAVIPARVPHEHGACAYAALMFLDGDDVVSRELSRGAEARCQTWVRDMVEVSVPREPTPAQARVLLASVVATVDPQAPPPPRHPATRRMCEYLDGNEGIDLAQLSREAGLSPRQMRHTFARDVGISMRAYVRWKRVRRAIAAVEQGASLSAAAAAAGFADSAHLSRVFREQFGIAPSQGLGSVRWRTLD